MGREIYRIPPILRLVPIRNIRNDQSYDGRIYPYEHTPIHSKSIQKLWIRHAAAEDFETVTNGLANSDPLLALKVHLLVRKKLNPGANGISNDSSHEHQGLEKHVILRYLRQAWTLLEKGRRKARRD